MKRILAAFVTLSTPLLLSAHPGHPGHDFEWGFTPLILSGLLLVGAIATGLVLRRRDAR